LEISKGEPVAFRKLLDLSYAIEEDFWGSVVWGWSSANDEVERKGNGRSDYHP